MTLMRLPDDDTPLLEPLLLDGRPFLTMGSLGLLLAGGFAIFLAATGQFLPHDVASLGMTAEELCGFNECTIVHFMIHDRVAFGGILMALGVMYLWLVHFPLRQRQPWAWWTLLVSNVVGFASFFNYLAHGYLDIWHAAATVVLLPCFAAGFAITYGHLPPHGGIRCVLAPAQRPGVFTRAGFGRYLLLGTCFGIFCAGTTIAIVCVTVIFVPQDLEYMKVTAERLNAINPRLIPLIAHDRAGFGAGVFNLGLVLVLSVWCAKPSRHLWQALMLAGAIGFGTAIGIHPIVGYNNLVHLAPAVLGAIMYFAALAINRPAAAVEGRAATAA